MTIASNVCARRRNGCTTRQKNPKQRDWDKFHHLKREVLKAIRWAHWDYINRFLTESLEQNDSKSFWHYVKSERQDSVRISAFKSKGSLHHGAKEKAEILNNQFK